MEYLDIIDSKTGKNTGKKKSKSEVHKNGYWHRTVHVWFVNSKDDILLQLRAKTKEDYPNSWDISSAGHISSGEDSITGALREIKEEIGIDVPVNELKKIGVVTQQTVLNSETYINKEHNDVYLVRADLEIDKLKIEKKELKEVRWISILEFKKWVAEEKGNLVPHPKEYKLLFKVLEEIN